MRAKLSRRQTIDNARMNQTHESIYILLLLFSLVVLLLSGLFFASLLVIAEVVVDVNNNEEQNRILFFIGQTQTLIIGTKLFALRCCVTHFASYCQSICEIIYAVKTSCLFPIALLNAHSKESVYDFWTA